MLSPSLRERDSFLRPNRGHIMCLSRCSVIQRVRGAMDLDDWLTWRDRGTGHLRSVRLSGPACGWLCRCWCDGNGWFTRVGWAACSWLSSRFA